MKFLTLAQMCLGDFSTCQRVHASAPGGCSPRVYGGVEYSFGGFFTCQRVRASAPGGCSPRAYGGVEYSFGGFFKREDSVGPGFLLSPTACTGDGDSLVAEVGPFAGVVVSFDGLLVG